MSEENKTPIEFPDEVVRRFLLGDLSSSEQPAFEQGLFSDNGLEDRVRRAELELADDYAYGRLAAAERDLFERKFLVSAERHRKLEVSKGLRERFAPVAAAKPKVRVWSLFTVTRPAWRLAFGAVVLLILFATALLVIKEPRLTQRITEKIIPRRPAPRSAPQEANHPTNESIPEHQVTPSPMPVHDQSSSSMMSVALAPAPETGEVPCVNPPKGVGDVVRFQLAARSDQRGPYRAELLTVEGQTVFTVESIKPPDAPGAPVDFDVPAALLKAGNYQIKLTQNNVGATEGARSYYFRVQ
jgi:hypothetical protein